MPSLTSAANYKNACKALGSSYNARMDALAHIGMDFLTVLFFAGMAGSAVVVVISFVEDFAELFNE